MFNEVPEARRDHRFKAKEGAVAVLKPESKILGQIIDISLGGLSFHYMQNDIRPNENSQLTIFYASERFNLDGLAFKVVSDTVIESGSCFSSIIMRRCSVIFTHLTDHQTSKLEYFIRQCTLPQSWLEQGVYCGAATAMSF